MEDLNANGLSDGYTHHQLQDGDYDTSLIQVLVVDLGDVEALQSGVLSAPSTGEDWRSLGDLLSSNGSNNYKETTFCTRNGGNLRIADCFEPVFNYSSNKLTTNQNP